MRRRLPVTSRVFKLTSHRRIAFLNGKSGLTEVRGPASIYSFELIICFVNFCRAHAIAVNGFLMPSSRGAYFITSGSADCERPGFADSSPEFNARYPIGKREWPAPV